MGQLKTVISGISGPIVIGGDLNTIVRVDERTGGNGRLSADSLAFGDWINELSLIDIGFSGNQYTWRRGKEESSFIAKRLDRVLCCAQTRLQWQNASVLHLPFLTSDHAPLLLRLAPVVKVNAWRRPFRFEAAWLQHPSFKEMLSNSWTRDIDTKMALQNLQVVLKKWNKEVFGEIQVRKDKIMKEIQKVQEEIDVNQTDELLQKEEELAKALDVTLKQEEVLWFQKSRDKWVTFGDRSTKFFHMSTIIRRRRNTIDTLKDDDGK